MSNSEVTLFTARGSATGKDWVETTKLQLKKWGVLYDQLLFGKPAGDIYIDDKAINITDWVQENSIDEKI